MNEDAAPRPSPLREIVQPFADLARAPRALWALNLSYLLEGFAYFGMAYYIAMYFNQYVHLSDPHAGYMAGTLTSGITFAMLFFGGRVDRWGVRRALLVAIVLMAIGRLVLMAAPASGLAGGALFSRLNGLALTGILIVVIGFGIYQPAVYTGTRQVSTEATSSMAFAMLYAMNNLGGWLPTFMPAVRDRVGIQGSMGFFGLVSLLGLLLVLGLLTPRTWRKAEDAARAAAPAAESHVPAPQSSGQGSMGRLRQWLRSHPLADAKFSFFIFCLIPVQTLFAINILVLPQYVNRAYAGTWLGANFEAASAFNSLLIFILCPIVAALSARAKVYRMMMFGTLVMGAAPFLLAFQASAAMLVAYILVLSVGEAMWQPRFLQFAAEIAPEGRTGVYMGVAQLPWFLTKMIVPLYSGASLARWCPMPGQGELRTGAMWLAFGLVSSTSFLMLLAAQRWVGKDFKTRA